MYYLYPQEFFYYATRVGPDTGLSSFSTFLPPTCLVLFAGLLVGLKVISGSLNLQSMLYTANILGGFWGFYLLTKYIIGDMSNYSKALRLCFSFMYVFSIFIFYTLLNSQLIAIFLLSTLPLSLYLYIRGIKENKKYFLIITAFIWTVFCYLSVSLPWFAGAMIGISPILLYYFRNTVRSFVLANLFFACVLILFNLFWIAAIPYTYALSGNTSTTASISSVNFRLQNEEGIRSVSDGNTIFYPLLNTYQADIQRNYQWPYLPVFEKWYMRILLLNTVWFGIILVSFSRFKKKIHTGLPLAIATSFVVSMFFYTARVGNWGLTLFIWLSNTLPGFVMFRNMYDKFGLGISFAFAITVLICSEILYKEVLAGRMKKILYGVMCFILFLNALPYLAGKFQNLPIWTTQNSYGKLTKLNSDYLELTNYIKQHPSVSRPLWVPLEYGNVSQIQDQYDPTHYYNGTSPFLMFAEKNDFSGILSFESSGEELANDIRNRRYASAGRIFQRYNVGYVIVNNTLSDELQKSYLCGEGLCLMQDAEYKQVILGDKVRDFGSRYSLYTINKDFSSEKMYISDSIQSVHATKPVTFTRINPREYRVHLENIKKNDFLVFLDAFSPAWHFYSPDAKTQIPFGTHIQAFNYANAWIATTDTVGGLDLLLRFDLGLRYYLLLAVSILSLVAGSIYIFVISMFKRHL
jgi:hypothetical protein